MNLAVAQPLGEQETDHVDPEVALRELNHATTGLAKTTSKLARLIQTFEGSVDKETGEMKLGVQARYDIAVEEELLRIVDSYEEQNKRPPAEDIRLARAKRHVRTTNEPLYVEYTQALADMKAYRLWISNHKEVISARQTLLKRLSEMGA